MEIKDGKEYLAQVKKLIGEYAKRLDRDLSFQNIDDEMNDPGKKYTAPEGEILVAVQDDAVLGMVAYHRHTAERCEMKRLYVTPQARRLHVGEELVKEIIIHAKSAGYKEMVLDTIAPLKAAIRLYQKFGFVECEAYYDNPMDDVIYFKKKIV